MKRMEKFESLKSHNWYKNQFAKLKKTDLDFCVDFIRKNNDLSDTDFWRQIRDARCTSTKKADIKRFNICMEILDCCRS